MGQQNNFWITEITKWEKQRYQGFFSDLLYSSLKYRQEYLAFILNQIPPGSRVVEVGCGSGKLYGLLRNKKNIHFTGYDISDEAIQLAQKQYPDASVVQWHCKAALDIKNIEADYIISAGLFDWLSDQEITSLLKQNNFRHHVHSFSLSTDSWKKKLHRIFSFVVSRKNNIKYEPRTFTKEQISNLMKPLSDLQFIQNPRLSFGSFVHNLPKNIHSNFRVFLIDRYFSSKNNGSGMTERLLKKKEFTIIQKNAPVTKNKQVLEIGSGYGFYTRWLASLQPASLKAIDPAVNTKNHYKSEAYSFEQVSLENLDDTKKYDLIYTLGVAEFVSDLPLFFDKLLSHVAPGGSLVLLIPDEYNFPYFVYRKFHNAQSGILNTDIETTLTLSLNKSSKRHEIRKINGGFLNNLFIIKVDE